MPYDSYGSYYDEDELEEDDDEGVLFDRMVLGGVLNGAVDKMTEKKLRNEYRGTFDMLPLIVDGVDKTKRRRFF